ncbi:hypothetical protein BDV12DRAFT_175575 [Aspergillus spectabilis]
MCPSLSGSIIIKSVFSWVWGSIFNQAIVPAAAVCVGVSVRKRVARRAQFSMCTMGNHGQQCPPHIEIYQPNAFGVQRKATTT